MLRWHRMLRRVRPDIVETGTPKAGLLGMVAARWAGVPVRVYLLRGLRLESEHGLRHKLLSLLERVACGNATHVIAVSPSLRNRAIELGLCAEPKIVVIGKGSSNGVAVRNPSDPSDVADLRRELAIGIDEKVIGFVGRLTPDKGIADLNEASTMLGQAGTRHVLLIIGGADGDDSPPILEGQTRQERRTVCAGHVDDPERYFPLMDVLCLPTYREGFPNVVLEAAVAGVPTVTTSATGAKDSVIHDVTGLVARVGDAEDLARWLTVLVENDALRHRLGAAAAEYVSTHFSRQVVQASHADYLFSLLPQTQGSQRRHQQLSAKIHTDTPEYGGQQ